ncbi:MAG: hypothetical protein A2534_04575 [Candidatus Magasanikbacteria bacterium RIFOXYD2_FULL_39_9]|uniref:Uncharacterized protein n=1 Tax=Candidatus Magasanikbacteria bacterium RIFOXYD1_FULL_40_23 TaxID=1798705 RepID=A0A1F6PAW9_9BACT|nr:MAG: hypothetical protein A2534_04575 [Candidatus Magasanikbacteria bacterium RIFOXYD2_FULL_39_9]OGH93327.1 MAG: hypothetical protein A2563_01830 [Candidatus Magasanikbacteria bacterium RIFOXYD1_FULL_40_23]
MGPHLFSTIEGRAKRTEQSSYGEEKGANAGNFRNEDNAFVSIATWQLLHCRYHGKACKEADTE